MKTQRRHELQTNDLAANISRWLETAKPYTAQIIWVCVAVVVVVAGAIFFLNQSEEQSKEAWEDYFVARARAEDVVSDDQLAAVQEQQQKLRSVADQYPNSAVGDFARLASADVAMAQGIQLYASDREAARKLIRSAIRSYRTLKDEAKLESVRDQATFNLGLAHEMLGEVESAIKQYSNVDGVMAKYAQNRAETLEHDPQAGEFYAWYKEAAPASPISPSDAGTPGKRPDFAVRPPAFDPNEFGAGEKPLVTEEGKLNLPSFPFAGSTEKRYGEEEQDDEGAPPEPELLPNEKSDGEAAEPEAAKSKQPAVQDEPAASAGASDGESSPESEKNAP